MFVLRDYLEYSGLLPEKKRVPAKELQLYIYKKELYEEFLDMLTKALA